MENQGKGVPKNVTHAQSDSHRVEQGDVFVGAAAAGGFDDHIAQFDGDVGFGEVAFIDGEQDVAGLGQRGGRLSTISRAGPIPGPSISAAVVAAVIAVGAISMPCTG
jgi:hypothetical protein